jgi:type IV pilus assembly protein PilY1
LERRTFTRSAGGQVLLSNSTLNAVDYLNTDPNRAQDGWYVNLPTTSEMVVSNPQRILSSLFFVSIRPNSNPTSCDGLPEASLFSLDPVSGLPAVNVFGMQSGQKVVGIPISDQKIAFALDRTGRAPTYGGSLQSSSGRGVVIRGIAKTEDTGIQMPDQESRLQWREVPGLRTFSK